MTSKIIGTRVAFLTNAAGLNDLTIDGAIDGRLGPGDVFSADDKVRYYVEDSDGSGNWELREGTYKLGPERIERGTFIASQTEAPIVLSGSTGKKVFVDADEALLGAERGRLNLGTTAGTAIAYTLAVPAGPQILEDGVEVLAWIHADNTSSDCTLDAGSVAGATPKPIRAGQPARKIAVGALKQDSLVRFKYRKSTDTWLAIAGLTRTIKTIAASTYTVLEEDHDQKLVFTNASGCAVTVPQATGQFAAPFSFTWLAAGGVVTFTPTTSTINDQASASGVSGTSGEVVADAGNYRTSGVAGLGGVAIVGEARGLVGNRNAVNPNSQVDYSATELVLKDAGGATRLVALKATASLAAAGASGLDTGAEAASTWYYAWAIDLTAPIVNAAVTVDPATEKVTYSGGAPAAGTPVQFGGTAVPAGLAANTTYYVVSPAGNDFQVASSPDAGAINITSAGAAVTFSTVPAVMFSTSATAPTMPAGCSFKALIGAWYNASGSNLRDARQVGRKISVADVLALNNVTVTTPNTFQSLSLGSIIPPIAIRCSGIFGPQTNGSPSTSIAIAADANGTGRQQQGANWLAANLMDGYYAAAPFNDLTLITPQTLYWTASGSLGMGISITGFEI